MRPVAVATGRPAAHRNGHVTSEITTGGLSRRSVLTGAGLLGAGALAGCSPPGPGPDRPGPATPGTGAATGVPRFPAGFRWGAATSAYQVEGAAREGGRGASIWDTFARTPGRTRGGATGDVAADHYHRYATDLDLMRDLGLRSYRFSVSWPRVQPAGRGRANPAGLDFYRRLVDGLRERGIEPMVTLFHWDLPQALQDAGGWTARDTAQRFADYAAVLFDALGDRVPAWLTLNEPKTIVTVGHVQGVHAPGLRDADAATVVTHHLNLAHGLAVRAYRASGHRHRIGTALNLSPVYPAGDAPAGPEVDRVDVTENRLYLDPVLKGRYPDGGFPPGAAVHRAIRDGDLGIISSPIDLLGVQYYGPATVDPAGRFRRRYPTSQAEWQQIHPEGLYDLLVRLKRDYGDIPLSITENGIPVVDALEGDEVHDTARIDFLRDHFTAAHRAIEAGVRLESYHVWSLLDNFEWAEGYAQRWGLVYVDFGSQRRVWKDSARWYRDVIAGR